MNAGPRQGGSDRAALARQLRAGGGSDLHAAVLAALQSAGDRTVISSAGRTYSGGELARWLVDATERMAALGIQRGDTALLAVRPGVEMLVILLALMRLGAAGTPFVRGAGPELFRSRLEMLGAKWIFGESLLYTASTPSAAWALRPFGLEMPDLGRLPGRHVVVGPRVPGVPRGALRWADFIASAGGAGRVPLAEIPVPDLRTPAMIVFTSGTTGAPKGVRHTAGSAAAAVSLILENLDVTDSSLVYNHNVHSIVATLLARAPTHLAPLRFRPARWLRDVARARATHAFLRPWDAWRLVEHCRDRGARLPDTLRRVYLFSAPVTTTLLRRLHDLGTEDLRLASAYGMTEALPVAWVDSRERLAWSGEGDLVGRPVTDVEVRIGSEGTLQVRGPNVHGGYLGSEPTEWHDSGDFARLESDGSIVLLGRAKDMIIRDSFNIYPALYEETITKIGGMTTCALVGVPDPRSADERVCLVVEPDSRPGAVEHAALRSHIHRAVRSGPHRIDRQALPDEIRIVERMPRNERGKIDRAELRRMIVEDGGALDRWVVVPCHNEESRAGDTIDALAGQTLQDFTLVLVDNGSTDRTRQVIEERLERWPDLRAVVIEEPLKGTGAAADSGFRYAIERGADIIFRTDADCLPRPDWLEELDRFMRERELDAAGGRLVVRTDDVSLSPLQLVPSRLAMRLLPLLAPLRRSNRGEGYLSRFVLMPGPNVAIRAETYLDCGGYPRVSFDHRHIDKEIANALRRVSPRLGYATRAVVAYSERRTEAWGVANTIRWILHRGGHDGVTDVR